MNTHTIGRRQGKGWLLIGSALSIVCLTVLATVPSAGQGTFEPGIAGVRIRSPGKLSALCPATVTFGGTIIANGRLTASFMFELSNGDTTPVQTITFSGPDEKAVSATWRTPPGAEGFEGWVLLRTLTPNLVVSERRDFSVHCTGSTGTVYTITDLGSEYKFGSRAYGINDSGQVVGYYLSGASNCMRAFLYEGSLPARDIGGIDACSYATAINGRGQVAINKGFRPFIYDPGAPTLTRVPLPREYGNTFAYGINNSGVVVGEGVIVEPAKQTSAFIYSGGGGPLATVARSLGTLGGSVASALSINDSGVVVGKSHTRSSPTPSELPLWYAPGHAFVYRGRPMQDLNDLADVGDRWELRQANAISHKGHIVGLAYNRIDGTIRAFMLWPRSSAVIDLGTYLADSTSPGGGGASVALAVNDDGVPVGYAYGDATGAGNYEACIFRKDEEGVYRAYRLSAMISEGGWILSHATGINNRGQIVGWGYKGTRETAFLLTPIR